MRIYWLILSIIVLSLPQTLKAQVTPKYGYLLLSSGDTLWGKLDFTTKQGSIVHLNFKPDEKTDRTYEANQYLGFGFPDGRLYLSGVVEGQFVEALQLGELDLFRSGSDFLLRKDSTVYKLETSSTIIEREEENVQVDSKKWLGILSYLTSDCSENLQKYLRGTRLSERTLFRVVNAYNQCINPTITETPKEGLKWMSTDYGVSLGRQSTLFTVNYFPVNSPIVQETSPGIQTGLTVGALITNTFPRVSSHFQLAVNPTLINYTFQTSLETITRYDYIKVEYYTTALPVTLGYTFRARKFSVGPFIGFTFDFNFLADENRTSIFKNGFDYYQEDSQDALTSVDFQYGTNYGMKFSYAFSKYSLSTILRGDRTSQSSLFFPQGERLPVNKTDNMKINAYRFSINLIISKR